MHIEVQAAHPTQPQLLSESMIDLYVVAAIRIP